MPVSSCTVRDAVVSLEECISQVTLRMALGHWGDFLPWQVGEDAYAVL